MTKTSAVPPHAETVRQREHVEALDLFQTIINKEDSRAMTRIAEIVRKTKETDIKLQLDLDGSGKATVDTGIGF